MRTLRPLPASPPVTAWADSLADAALAVLFEGLTQAPKRFLRALVDRQRDRLTAHLTSCPRCCASASPASGPRVVMDLLDKTTRTIVLKCDSCRLFDRVGVDASLLPAVPDF